MATTHLSFERKGIEFYVECEFHVSGCYRAATWYDPPEYPELDLGPMRAVNIRTMKTVKAPLKLTREEQKEIEARLWAELEAPRDPD